MKTAWFNFIFFGITWFLKSGRITLAQIKIILKFFNSWMNELIIPLLIYHGTSEFRIPIIWRTWGLK